MYTFQAVGWPGFWVGPIPATSWSPSFAIAYPPYCGSGLTSAVQPNRPV